MIISKYILATVILLFVESSILHATTYTFIGPGDPQDGNPLYTTLVNWENGLYPGTTIAAGDSVIIKDRCVNNFNELHVYGHLKVEDRLDGEPITVFESGALELNGTIGNPITAYGIVSGTGVVSTALTCEGCTLYPGGIDQVGLIDIATLITGSTSTIVFDIISESSYDVIEGRGASLSGHLLLNFYVDSKILTHCVDYRIIRLRSPALSINLESIKSTSNDNLSAHLAGSGIVSVFFDSGLDRALHFDGTNDYVSSTESLGQARTIEFRMTPESIGPSEVGQMIFNINDDLLRYIIINSTTSAFSNETLSIKNGGGFGENWLFTTYSFEPGETYHISIVADDEDRYTQIYVNGEQVLDVMIADPPSVYNIENFDIGTRNNDLFYEGKIDEIRIWSVIRSPEQIEDNAISYLDPTDTSGLSLYYKFDQGIPYEDNTCIDFLEDDVNSQVATLHNFALDFTEFNGANNSNWVYPGCRQLLVTDDGASNWNDSNSWRPVTVPDKQCHDVLIDGVEGPAISVQELSQAECITLEVSPNQTFIINAEATFEVKGN